MFILSYNTVNLGKELVLYENKNLKSEIKGLLSNVEKVLGKDSIQYQNWITFLIF